MIRIAVYDKDGNCIAESKGDKQVHLLVNREYRAGDCIVLDSDERQFMSVKLEACIEKTLVYSSGGSFRFFIPFGEERMPYPQGAFEGALHILEAMQVLPSELTGNRDLSTNPLDIRGETTLFPHCTASVETRDESIFAARNTIDGLQETNGHGSWPYTSWGDNEDPDAEIEINFGRNVIVDRVVINLRSDFPHDNYWKQLDIVLRVDKVLTVGMKKTGEDQCFDAGGVITDRVKLCRLRKDETDPSPFPALTHWQVFGSECEE